MPSTDEFRDEVGREADDITEDGKAFYSRYECQVFRDGSKDLDIAESGKVFNS